MTAGTAQSKQTPVDLSGEWKQVGSQSAEAWQGATIKGNTIEINWVSDKGDTKSLYWVGDVTVPSGAGKIFTWTSTRDQAKTESALLASLDDTKEFTYDNGVISYKASALGTTTTMKLERQ